MPPAPEQSCKASAREVRAQCSAGRYVFEYPTVSELVPKAPLTVILYIYTHTHTHTYIYFNITSVLIIEKQYRKSNIVILLELI
jgi:hypothetical protein